MYELRQHGVLVQDQSTNARFWPTNGLGWSAGVGRVTYGFDEVYSGLVE